MKQVKTKKITFSSKQKKEIKTFLIELKELNSKLKTLLKKK